MSDLIENKETLHAMYRRWAYMLIAVAAAAFLFNRPVLSFQEDKGIIYVRSFTMNEKLFVVTQTEMATGAGHVTAQTSVKGLYYANMVMLWGGILCFLCFFSNLWRIRLAQMTALAAGAYYLLLVYYSLEIADLHFATFYPTWAIILPGVVIYMMVAVWRNVVHTELERADEAKEDPVA